MIRVRSIFDFNMKTRVSMLALAIALVVALAFASGRIAMTLSVISFTILMVLLVIRRGKCDGAIRSISSCLCMAIGTIMYSKEHAGFMPLLVGGVLTVGFGIIAITYLWDGRVAQVPGMKSEHPH